MANNRMWLVNRRLGARVLLAKAWGTGTWNAREPLNLQIAFDNDHYPFTDWELEYEETEMPAPGEGRITVP